MGWVWSNDNDDDSEDISSSVTGLSNESTGGSNPRFDVEGGRYATRRVVMSQCRTEEVEPGKFVRKCEKTEQIFKDCVGRPSEMVQSNKEYTEEDVTGQMIKPSYPVDPAERGLSSFPGLRNDMEGIERSFFSGINRFFEAAEEMTNEFFKSVGVPHTYDGSAVSSHQNPGIGIESEPPKKAFQKNHSDGDIDISSLATEV